MSARFRAALCAAAALALGASGAGAQETHRSDAFLDPVARELYIAAAEGWKTLDESVRRYSARIDQRIAASIRTPLRDRVIYHNETAVRAFWERDYDPIVQVLGTRSEYPGRDIAMREGDLDWLDDLPFDSPFEPGSDRLFMPMGDPSAAGAAEDAYGEDGEEDDGEFFLIHPLARGGDSVYRFESGDTITLSLPDGRRLDAVRLNVLPREAASRHISGALWIEPESGALVRAAYRLSREFDAMRDVPEVREEDEAGTFRYVPGLFKPWTFDLTLVSVDYALWDFRAWLPRSMRIEGEAAAGVLRFPVHMDMAYQIESVVLDGEAEDEGEGANAAGPGDAARADEAPAPRPADDLEEVHFETRAGAMAFVARLLAEEDGVRYELLPDSAGPASGRRALLMAPEELALVAESPHLPPPIWDREAGFTSPEEVEEYLRDLADLPAAPVQQAPWNFDWGWARQDLIRYNRAEGLSVGGRFDWDVGGFHTLAASARFGLADLRPKARLELQRSTVLRRLSLGAYSELRAADPRAGHFGLGNSLSALLFARDEGEYYLARGLDLTWRPPEGRRESFLLRAYAERQEAAPRETHFNLVRVFDGNWGFRPNLEADGVDEIGAEARVSPWWGSDPLDAQFGVELQLRGAGWRSITSLAQGRYAQAEATARAVIPVGGGGWEGWRLGFEAAAGNSWGDVPVQRHWFLGSSPTLRGYRASTLSGRSFMRGRAEVQRSYHGIGASLFGDIGWAPMKGPRRAQEDVLYGVGIGATILDGLVRLDLSHGLKGTAKAFRIDLYLDSIL